MEVLKSCDVEDEFQSCCAEEEEWQDTEESLDGGGGGFVEEELDEFSVRMFFKGVSVSKDEGLGPNVSGIGVVMERPVGVPILQVQKKLDFYVERVVAEHLALMDGLLEALRNGVRRVFAYTDSEQVYDQIAKAEVLEEPLLVALGLRILEHADKLEAFVLKLVPSSDLQRPLWMAQEAAGIDDLSSSRNGSSGICSFCEANAWNSETICCPYPNCSALLELDHISLSRASSSSQSSVNCIECPQCHRLACITCGSPWHPSMTCEEYQNLSAEERDDDGESILGHLAHDNNWRRCHLCRQLIELAEGCHRMICRCGHEFCYFCGAEYRDGLQNCLCALSDDEHMEQTTNLTNQEPDLWIPATVDAYSEQERAQLALIQRFLAGGFSINDHQPCQSPPRCSDSYMDTIKDLYQLPWLERFVSVISDSYQDDHIQ